eukprot:Gb_02470 [translate_table: standard]
MESRSTGIALGIVVLVDSCQRIDYLFFMGNKSENFLMPVLIAFAIIFSYTDAEKQNFVVYMGSSTNLEVAEMMSGHMGMIASVHQKAEDAASSLIYSYTAAFNGFSARLTKEQAEAIKAMSGVVSVFPSRRRVLHTTRSWDFLGLAAESTRLANTGSDVIIGLLDTGVWPESPSFNDQGFGPIPSRWKGKCVAGEQFTTSNCNRKLIGARWYNKAFGDVGVEDGGLSSISTKEYRSARDSRGHGTHTATTAGGSKVEGANYYGLASGVARGGAPMARIATYKVCSEDGCEDADILAGFDDAISDGVDILSISLGSPPFLDYDITADPNAIGGFHAVQRGILVVCSGGNGGPDLGTVGNSAPWILTVGATTTDRSFSSKVILGNNQTFQGWGINYFSLREPLYPLVYGGDIPSPRFSSDIASECAPDSLDSSKVKGKIVFCAYNSDSVSRKTRSTNVKAAGGIGMITADTEGKFIPSVYDVPATSVSLEIGNEILAYIRSTRNPMATIQTAETVLGIIPAPVIANFSSRGPASLSDNLLKPDIVAPGVNILAGWSGANPYSNPPRGQPLTLYALVSGTSMSCPHASGTAAFIKSMYPDWSPSALKSALVTTASTMNSNGQKITNEWGSVASGFDAGAGLINPTKALQPGLVYENEDDDHLLFLCYYGLATEQIGLITGNKSIVCPAKSGPDEISNLNYPTIAISNLSGKRSIRRTLTNKGAADSVYQVSIDAPPELEVKISPEKLIFSAAQKKISFQVDFTASTGKSSGSDDYVFGSFAWSDGNSIVRSAFAVKRA